MEFEEIWNRNWKEWKDLNAKMRKEFDNAKAKHGLNKKNGIRAIGLSFLRDQKLRDQKRKRERRRGEEEEEEEEEKEKKKRREGERKSKRYRTLYSFVWNYGFLYEFPYNCMVSSLPQT